ncbi:hypothetical protein KW801_01425 [Candidatus Saccharibacteria bacterium]|nr:hypothetical protein [Candidatus Saccharibacteria bacterium]
MDDIRRPQRHLPRRDYSLPGNQAVRPQPTPTSQQPFSEPPQQPEAQGEPLLVHNRRDYDYRHSAPDQPVSQPAASKSRRGSLVSPKLLGSMVAAAILLVAGVLYISRPAKKVGATAAQLAKKSSFSFYYPQPLPAGYSYTNNINAFEGGQAYFMLASGKKHIIIHEQAANSANSSANELANPQSLDSSIGKVSLGTTAGEPSAQIIAGSTYILVNTTGAVSKTELVGVINSLKVIK